MALRKYPCLMEHDGQPGMHARFMRPASDLLEDVGIEYIRTPAGVIESVYSKQFRAALHFHEMDESEWPVFKERVLTEMEASH